MRKKEPYVWFQNYTLEWSQVATSSRHKIKYRNIAQDTHSNIVPIHFETFFSSAFYLFCSHSWLFLYDCCMNAWRIFKCQQFYCTLSLHLLMKHIKWALCMVMCYRNTLDLISGLHLLCYTCLPNPDSALYIFVKL